MFSQDDGPGQFDEPDCLIGQMVACAEKCTLQRNEIFDWLKNVPSREMKYLIGWLAAKCRRRRRRGAWIIRNQ